MLNFVIQLNFLGREPTSICHFFCPSVCQSIHRKPNLRICALSDHSFWYTCKLMIDPGFFSFFFLILILRAVRRVKGQKVAQSEK